MKRVLVFVGAVIISLAMASPGMAMVKLTDSLSVGLHLYLEGYFYHADKQFKARGVPVGQTTKEEDINRTVVQFNKLSVIVLRWQKENYGVLFTPYIDGELDETGIAMVYGWWDITRNLRLRAGKGPTLFSTLQPEAMLASSEAKTTGIGYGNYFSGYNAHVNLDYKINKLIHVKAGIVDPRATDSIYILTTGFKSNGGTIDNVSTLPKFEVAASFRLPIKGLAEIQTSAFWQKQTFDNVQGPENEIQAYGLCLGTNNYIGPVRVIGELQYGQNWWNSRGYGYPVVPIFLAFGVSGAFGGKANSAGYVENSKIWAYWFQASYDIGRVTPTIIFGRQTADRSVDGVKDEIALMEYGFRVPIRVHRNCTITPEFMVFNNGWNTVSGVKKDFGTEWTAGVEFAFYF